MLLGAFTSDDVLKRLAKRHAVAARASLGQREELICLGHAAASVRPLVVEQAEFSKRFQDAVLQPVWTQLH